MASLDVAAVAAAGEFAAQREARGRTVNCRDTLIAGIAWARRAVLATRNVRHVEGLETGLLNPFKQRDGRP